MKKVLICIDFEVVFLALSCGDDSPEQESENTNDNSSDTGDTDTDDQQDQCGNKIIDAGEVCDGGAVECTSIDPGYAKGFATCKNDCSGWDTANCQETSENGGNSENDGSGDNNSGNGDNSNSEGGIWVDPTTYLMWENPMGNKGGTDGIGTTHANAVTYCDNLVLAGADDWRLPTIDELRTLVRGISTIATGGTCPTTETCTNQKTCNEDPDNTQGFGNSCLGCEALNSKYDPEISYLNMETDCQLSSDQLEKNECYIVPEMFGDPCSGTWSNTPNTDGTAALMKAYWYLNYKSGIIHSDADIIGGAGWVRCVRQGTAADIP